MSNSFDGRDTTLELARWQEEETITNDERQIIETLWHSAMCPSILVRVAIAASRMPGRKFWLTRAHAWSAIRSLAVRRLIRIVDPPVCRSYERRCDAEASRIFWVEGTIPPVDCFEFTRRGALLVLRLYEGVFLWNDKTPIAMILESVGTQHRILTTDVAFGEKYVHDLEEEWGTTAVVRGVSPFGPWRDRPWRYYPSGYCIDIEEAVGTTESNDA